jgi:hypothetical protein
VNRQISIALMLALAAALIAAGCGDGDGSTSSTAAGEPLSKAEFISQADQICAEGDAKIDEGGQAFAGTAGEKVDELVGTVIVPGYRDEIEQLRELTPPEGDEAEVEEFLNTFEQGIDALDQNPEQLAGGAALKTITEARVLAFKYGFKSCARS